MPVDGDQLPRPTRDTPTEKPVIERTFASVASLFAQYVAGYAGRSAEQRGKDAGQAAVWSMAELQDLLDEWIVADWQNRPHDGLRHPLTPGRGADPERAVRRAARGRRLRARAAGPGDYLELLPADLAGDQLLRHQDRPADLRLRR